MRYNIADKWNFTVLITSCALLCQSGTRIHRDKLPPDQMYHLIWQDEFNGNHLNLSKWSYSVGKRKGAYNSKSNVFLDGKGFLHLRVSTKNDTVFAGMISSDHHFETKYGYFECSAKLDRVMGVWPAFWILSDRSAADYGTPEKNGVEIDIFEYFPNYKKDTVTHNLHWGGYGVTHRELGMVNAPLKKTNNGFHVFGLEWTDHSYTAYVDGTETARGSNFISQVPEFVLLSIESDEAAAGPLDRRALPSDFIIDYIRVYKKDDPVD